VRDPTLLSLKTGTWCDEERDQCASRVSYNSFSIAGRRLGGVVFGAKRATALPARSIRNLVKFHLMVLPPNSPRFSFFRFD
jgi:hypothetical protein